MKDKINYTCYIGTVYSLLIYISKKNREEIEQTYFFFDESIAKEIRSNFNNSYVFKKKSGIRKYMYMFWLRILFLTKFKFIKDKIVLNYGQDHLAYSYLFIKHNFILIEDGTGTYSEYVEIQSVRYKEFIRKVFFGLTINEIYSRKYVQNVIFTGLAPIPRYLSCKAIMFDLQKELSSKDNQAKFMNYFNLNDEYFRSLKDCEVLILTQTLSEEGYLSELEKVEIYRKLIGKYCKYKVCLKPHPIEKTDYTTLFTDIEVIKGYFPIELMRIFGLSPKIVVTVSSTAVFSFKGFSQIDCYGSVIHPKLKNVLNDIMKPNIFLD